MQELHFYIYTYILIPFFLHIFFYQKIEKLHFLHQNASNSVKSRLSVPVKPTPLPTPNLHQLHRVSGGVQRKKRPLPNFEAAPVSNFRSIVIFLEFLPASLGLKNVIIVFASGI